MPSSRVFFVYTQNSYSHCQRYSFRVYNGIEHFYPGEVLYKKHFDFFLLLFCINGRTIFPGRADARPRLGTTLQITAALHARLPDIQRVGETGGESAGLQACD